MAESDATTAFNAGLRPGPKYAVNCPIPSQPPACTVPSAPTFASISAVDGTLTQEGTLEATPPADGGSAWTSVVWALDYFDQGTYHTLYQVDSTDSIGALSAGKVHLGATGLVAGHAHRARVAYCRTVGSQRGCTCWSSDTSISAMRSDFPAVKPIPPANTVQRVEDNFQRAYTSRTKKASNGSTVGGDGLGPDSIWEDEFNGGTNAGNGSFICKRTSGGGSFSHAIMGQGTVANYAGAWQTHFHSYAETKYQMEGDPECDGTTATIPAGYNMDVRARYYTTATAIRTYWAKLNYLHHQLPGTTHPTLVIGRTDIAATNALGIQDRLIIPFADTQDSDCTNDSSTKQFTDCSCWPRIADGRPLYLRIEARTSINSVPEIRATVAWEGASRHCGETGSGDILDCPYRCSSGWYSDDDTFARDYLNPANGQWGIDAHEGNYRVLQFRTGNELPTP